MDMRDTNRIDTAGVSVIKAWIEHVTPRVAYSAP